MKIIFLLIAGVLISCNTSKKINLSNVNQKHIQLEKQIDTVRVLGVDTTSLRALLECDSIGRVRVATLKIKDGEISRLKTYLENNELNVEVRTERIERVKEIHKIDTIYLDRKVVDYERVVIQLSWWEKGLVYLGGIFLMIIIYKLFIIMRKIL